MNINPKISNTHIYDYVVVGSGLTGLLITSALSKVTKNVLLIEAAESFGGHTQRQESLAGTSNNGLRFLPDSESARKSLDFLSGLLQAPINLESVENTPLTYEAGGLRPFLGFGSQPPEFYEEISYFLSHHSLQAKPEIYDWAHQLFEQSEADFITRSYVTKFIAAGTPDEKSVDTVSKVLINGQKNILGNNFIFCGDIQSLAQLLPESGLSARNRQKLSKSKFWTAVCLDLVHAAPVTDSTQLHVLNGTSQDDLGPCVGRFFAPVESLQLSQWVSFIDNESAEDAEQIASTLKKIKRQIKRAYPTSMDHLRSERILVASSIGGNGDLKINANQSLPSLSNFWVASPGLSSHKNILGCLQQAELVCSALGFHPTSTVEPVLEAQL